MINIDEVFKEMKGLIGCEFDENEATCCFVGSEENIIICKVEGYTSNFNEHGLCQLYNAYEDVEGSEIFNIWVNEEGIIIEVK